MVTTARWMTDGLCRSSISTACDATPFANAAPVTATRPPARIVDSGGPPSCRARRAAICAGGRAVPANPAPSQSSMDRRAIATVASGNACGAATHSASTRVACAPAGTAAEPVDLGMRRAAGLGEAGRVLRRGFVGAGTPSCSWPC